jgi:hypothetical protein
MIFPLRIVRVPTLNGIMAFSASNTLTIHWTIDYNIPIHNCKISNARITLQNLLTSHSWVGRCSACCEISIHNRDVSNCRIACRDVLIHFQTTIFTGPCWLNRATFQEFPDAFPMTESWVQLLAVMFSSTIVRFQIIDVLPRSRPLPMSEPACELIAIFPSTSCETLNYWIPEWSATTFDTGSIVHASGVDLTRALPQCTKPRRLALLILDAPHSSGVSRIHRNVDDW